MRWKMQIMEYGYRKHTNFMIGARYHLRSIQRSHGQILYQKLVRKLET